MTYAIPSLTRVPVAEKGITIADFLVPVRVGERVSPRLRNVLLVISGAVLIYLTARVSVPIPGTPVPFTLQNLGILVVGGALGLRRGGLAALLYVALGLVGLPFFAEGRGGLAVITGTNGGYLVGFVFAAALVGRLAELGWDRRMGGAIGATLLGTLVIYLVGVPWLAATTGMAPGQAIAKGLLPFVALDTVKLLAAAAVFPAAWWVVGRRPSDR
jgi:biotin transport system substrate-specific component